MREGNDEAVVHVLPANVPAVRIFPLLSWDHRISPDGHLVAIGVSTAEIREVAEALALTLDERLLRDVRVMVAAGRPVLNEAQR